MAQDKTFAGKQWINLTALLGLAVEDEAKIQNTGSANIRVENSIAAPLTEDDGVIVASWVKATASPGLGESIWVFAVDGTIGRIQHLIDIK